MLKAGIALFHISNMDDNGPLWGAPRVPHSSGNTASPVPQSRLVAFGARLGAQINTLMNPRFSTMIHLAFPHQVSQSFRRDPSCFAQ